ncbi:MAG: YccF domain-containing protein [Planctomycetaceae bacterium]
MSLLGNIIWLIFGGFIAGAAHILAGLLFCLTIIGIPFGYQEIKLGVATLVPFGMERVKLEGADSAINLILNVIWLVVWGWALALNHLFWALVLAITILGIPFAKQHWKLTLLSAWPFGYDLRPIDTPVHI